MFYETCIFWKVFMVMFFTFSIDLLPEILFLSEVSLKGFTLSLFIV